jgi:hypothetical protein
MHYSCLVIGNNPERKLKPFKEAHGNPKSKWDFYELGGAWEGSYTLRAGCADGVSDSAMKGEIEPESLKDYPFAIIHRGKFLKREDNSVEAIAEWDAMYMKLIDSLPDDTLLSMYDLHI